MPVDDVIKFDNADSLYTSDNAWENLIVSQQMPASLFQVTLRIT